MTSFLIYTFVFMLMALFLPEKVRLVVRNNDKTIKTRNRNIYLFASVLLMLFMAGLRRHDIGNDTAAYKSFFTHMGSGYYSFDSRFEIVFRYLTIGISKLTNDYTVFLVITSVLCFLPLARFIKRYVSSTKIFVTIFWLFAFTTFVSPLRQSIGLVFIFISIDFIEKKKPLFFAICILLAMLCHASAIVAIVLYPLYYIKPKSWKVFLTIAFVIVAVGTGAIDFFANRFLSDYYSRYLSVQSGFSAALFNVLFGIIPIFLDKYKTEDPEESSAGIYDLMRWSSVFYAGFYIASLYSSGAGRIAYYFLPMTIAYWCKIINKKSWSYKTRILIVDVLLVILLLYRILVIIYRPEWNSFFPFRYVWES